MQGRLSPIINGRIQCFPYNNWRQEIIVASDIGLKLIIRVGNIQDLIKEFMKIFVVKGIYSHEETGNEWTFKRDQDLRRFTKNEKINWYEYRQFGVFRGLKTRLNLLAIYKDALQNLPLKPPMEHYYVSSSYGPRKHPVTGKYRMHHGIDLAGTWQENISVSADGTVVFAGYHGSFGKVIRIRHNYGIMTTYGHLAKINVRRGDIVNEGQVIGKMGRTGKVKGAHLHYEISVNGKSQNPATYIKIGRNLLSRTSLKGFANIN